MTPKEKLMLSFNNIGQLEDKFMVINESHIVGNNWRQQIDKFEKLLKDEDFIRK